MDSGIKRIFVVGTAALVLSTCFELVGLGLIFPVVQLLTVDNLIQDNKIFNYVSNLTGVTEPKPMATIGVIFITASIFVKAIIGISSTYLLNKRFVVSENKFSSRLFEAYLRAPITWHHQNNSSEILHRLRTCTSMIFDTSLNTGMQWIADSIFVIGLIIILFIASPEAAITSLLFGGLGFLIVEKILKAPALRYSDVLHTSYLAENKLIFESMRGINEIRILSREAFFKNLFDDLRSRIGSIRYLSKTLLLAPRYIFEFFTAILILIVFLFLINNFNSEEVVALLALYGLAAMRLMPAVARLITTLNTIRLAIVGVSALKKDYVELFEFFPDKDGTSNLPKQQRQVSFKHKIVLNKISFAYTERAAVIDDVSIKINSGESIGIAGPSGAGKSTLISIILGILQPDEGEILVDSQKLDPTLSAFQRSIGLVPQHVFLADDTIKANIAFGVETDDIKLDQIVKALRDSKLETFVNDLPEGINTIIGEQGVKLSGGQRQRLGIARTLYDDPDILILDEATSSLDLETEAQITDVMIGLRGSKTLIVIAHRLSTIQSCDQIYYMKDGQIAAQGTFSELTKSNSEFQHLVELGQLQT
jgi:ATP-binding cassette, subfamily B, bacterial PglK